MTDTLKQARLRLEARRTELHAASEASSQSRAVVQLDQQSVGRLSRMDAIQSQAMAQAAERQRKNELARIEAALLRIDAGDYGLCDECGEAIAPGRLEINPSANLCVACAGR